MPVNKEHVALDIASQTAEAAGQLQDVLEQLQALEAWRAGSRIALSDYDARFPEFPDVAHANGQVFDFLLKTVMPALKAWLNAQIATGNITYADVIHMARRS